MKSSSQIDEGELTFWDRQWGPEVTPEQLTFDWLFGIIVPMFCLYLDPIVFKKTWVPNSGILEDHRIFAYLALFLQMALISAWLLSRRSPLLFTGSLAAGALLAFILGILILPYSLIGIIFVGVGLFGFIPFITAFVYARNAWRAWVMADSRKWAMESLVVVAFSFIVMLGSPAVSQFVIKPMVAQDIEIIAVGTPEEVQQAVSELKILYPLANMDTLIIKYRASNDSERRKLIARVYQDITGISIEKRTFQLDW